MMLKIALPFLAALLAVGLGQIPGGLQDIDINDPDFQKAVDFAVHEFNRLTNHHHYYSLVKVLKAHSQVVEGVKYIMTLKLGKTICMKGTINIDCPIIRGHEAKFVICKFSVWYRSWLNDMRLLGFRC